MKPWVTWCIDHKMAFVPYGVLILGAPIFIVAGVAQGICEAFAIGRATHSGIKHEIARRAERKTMTDKSKPKGAHIIEQCEEPK